uniref:ShKT domain-containing protein n=1 Tax=Globodera pallida TaxID=36090 RepID=A0A183CRM4_GLOPA
MYAIRSYYAIPKPGFCWSPGPAVSAGLQYHDWAFEPDPEVKEALRRLRLKDPYQYDLACNASLWPLNCLRRTSDCRRTCGRKWDDETFYLESKLSCDEKAFVM